MRCFDDNPGIAWTFLFAHPDDELAIAGWMSHLVHQGCRVSACWAHASQIRREESLAAMEWIGLPEQNCMFGDLPDGEFLGNLSELDSWVQDVLEETAAERYVSVAYEQGHQDHDALHYVVHRWTGAAHLEFPLYWHYAKTWQRIGEFADPSGAETRMLDIDEIGMKRAMLRCFESQTVARNVAGYEVLSRLRGKRPLLAEAERLRRVLKPDYSKPVHQEPARSKIMKCARWHQWENATAQWVASMGDPDWT